MPTEFLAGIPGRSATIDVEGEERRGVYGEAREGATDPNLPLPIPVPRFRLRGHPVAPSSTKDAAGAGCSAVGWPRAGRAGTGAGSLRTTLDTPYSLKFSVDRTLGACTFHSAAICFSSRRDQVHGIWLAEMQSAGDVPFLELCVHLEIRCRAALAEQLRVAYFVRQDRQGIHPADVLPLPEHGCTHQLINPADKRRRPSEAVLSWVASNNSEKASVAKENGRRTMWGSVSLHEHAHEGRWDHGHEAA